MEGAIRKVYYDGEGNPMEAPPPYVFQEFPKWKYKGDKAVVVNDADAEKALGPGWANSPAQAA